MKLQKQQYGVFAAGQWLDAVEKKSIHSPYDQSTVGEIGVATSAHLEESIAAAVKAFEITRVMSGFERQRILHAIAAELAAQHEEFARAICLEAGKPIKTARAEVDRAIFT